MDDRAELERRLAEAVAERDRAQAKLANSGFTDRAPAELVEAERQKAEHWAAEAEELEARLSVVPWHSGQAYDVRSGLCS